MKILEEICEILTCGVAKRPEYYKEGIPFLSSKNVKENRFILDHYNFISKSDYFQLTKYNKPKKGDILYTRVGSFGEAAVVDFDFAVFVSLTLIRPKKEIADAKYLMYYLNSPGIRSLANSSTSGIGVQNLNVSTVRKFPIKLPSITKQQKIAAILDKANELRQYNKLLIEKYDALTQSLFLDMFGDITNNKKFEIGTIENLIDIVRDGPHVSPKYSENGIPILSTRNIRPFELVNEEIKYVSVETHNQLTRNFKPQKEDILLTKGGTTGYAKIVDWDWEFCIWVHLAALRVKKDVSPKYIESALNSYYCYNQSQEQTRGIANKDLGLKRLINIKLPIPPLNLQTQFAERVKLIETQKKQAQAALAKSELLFQGLLQQAFKGELN